MSCYDGLLFKGEKLIVPTKERQNIIETAHSGHSGIENTLCRARQFLFWPNQTKDIINYVERCYICQQNQRRNIREPMFKKNIPEYPFQIVSSDIFQFKGHDFLLIADKYSGFFDFKQLKSTTANEIIKQFKKWFSIHGIPEILESDNGPQYTAHKFNEFKNEWKFSHITSSPHFPRSNGHSERYVQTAKNILKKCAKDGSDVYLALLLFRNTPRNDALKSTNERLFSRLTRSTLPVPKEKLKPAIVLNVPEKLKQTREKQHYYANQKTKPGPNFTVGDQISMQKGHRDWCSGKVIEKSSHPRSFMIQTSNGSVFRRNTHHLRKSSAQIPQDIASNVDTPKPPETTNASRMSVGVSTGKINEQSIVQPTDISVKDNENPSGSTVQTSNHGTQPIVTRYGRVVKPVKKF